MGVSVEGDDSSVKGVIARDGRIVDEAQYAFVSFVWIGYANERCVV